MADSEVFAMGRGQFGEEAYREAGSEKVIG